VSSTDHFSQFHSIFSETEAELDEEDVEEALETVPERASAASEDGDKLTAPSTVTENHDSDFEGHSPDRGE
jgi:hypothetical protein